MRVEYSVLRVSGLGSRVSGLGFRVPGIRFRVQSTGGGSTDRLARLGERAVIGDDHDPVPVRKVVREPRREAGRAEGSDLGEEPGYEDVGSRSLFGGDCEDRVLDGPA